MRRSCRYEELVAIYRDLDQAARLSLDAHLRECQACTARLTAYQQIDQSLQALPPLRLPVRLQQPWHSQLAARAPARSDRELRSRSGLVFGRILLPAGLIIGLVVGLWFLLAALADENSRATVTPTLTLTPTATVMALLDGDADAALGVRPRAAALSGTAIAVPAPQPTWTATRVGAAIALGAP
jgi:anti-sigma factor RsiW